MSADRDWTSAVGLSTEQISELEQAVKKLETIDYDNLQKQIVSIQAAAPAVDVNICGSGCVVKLNSHHS